MTITLTIPSWKQRPAFWIWAATTGVSVLGYALYLRYAPSGSSPLWEVLGGVSSICTLYGAGFTLMELAMAQKTQGKDAQ